MTTNTTTAAETEIRELLAGQENAMRTGDVEWLLGRYTADAVSFDLAPPLRHAGADLFDADGLRRWFAGFGGSVGYEITDLTVAAGDDLAYCHSLNRLSATPAGTDEGFEMWFRSTVCLRKTGAGWRVSHEHTSTPFYMDGSFLAATDLKP